MTDSLLPFINSLRASVLGLASGNATSFGVSTQGAITGRLLDYMLVQETLAPTLRRECYARMAALLPRVEAIGGSLPADALRELKTLCTGGDLTLFDRFLQLGSEVQSALLAIGTPEAGALARDIVDIEASCCGRLEAAVDAQFEASEKAGSAASAVRNARTYDETALRDFIRNAYPEEVDLEIEKSGYISGGTSKFTMLITLRNTRSLPRELVLRGDAGGMFCGAPTPYEYRLIKTVYEHGGCVPRPIAVEETGSVFGSPFMLVEMRGGASIGHMQNLPKQPNPALNEAIAKELATLHRIPASAFGNWIRNADEPSSAKAIEWIDEGLRNWQPLNMPSTVFSTAFDWLRRNAHINDRAPRTLVHGDYGLNNILVEGNRVTAILDWEFAHLGNPAYDLGYYRCMAEPLSSWEHFLECYGRAGAPVPDEDQLNYATLFAATRLGVMTCQVTKAFFSGEPSLVPAMVVGGNYYDMMVKRIGDALDKVL